MIRIFSGRFEKRIESPLWLSTGTMTAALLTGIFLSSLLFLIKGISPFLAIQKIFSGSFGSLYGIKETITKAIPLILISSGLCLAFRAKFWNIGAEGQLLCGAIGATWVALNAGSVLPEWGMIPAMFIAGGICGAMWGMIPAILKGRFRVDEAISSLMLNYIAAEFVQYLIYGPWKGKTQFGFPYTDDFPGSAVLPMVSGSRIHYHTLTLAVLAAVVLAFVIRRSRFGFEIRVLGESPEAGHYAGMNYNRTILWIMIVSGGLAGMAGVGEVAAVHKHLTYPWSISSGYGFTAIITAFLARVDPLLAILSSILFGGILVGGDVIQTSLGLPFATVNIFNGMILFSLLIGEFFQKYKFKFKPVGTAENV